MREMFQPGTLQWVAVAFVIVMSLFLLNVPCRELFAIGHCAISTQPPYSLYCAVRVCVGCLSETRHVERGCHLEKLNQAELALSTVVVL